MSGEFTVVRTEAAGAGSGHLFVDPAFIAYQSGAQGKPLTSFSALNSGGEAVACLTLAHSEDAWNSPVTGAFGGASAAPRASASAIFAVADAATEWLRDQGAAHSIIRLPPDAFADPTAAALENALFRNGWRLAQSDLNYHLPIVAPEAFLKSLGETKQKEVRRLQRSQAAYRRLATQDGRRAYDVIAENRAARGFPMTMSWPQVEALAAAFPANIAFSVVERGADLLAGAIVLELTPTYVYVFYWGEAPAFRRESPVSLLAEGLVAEHHARGVTVMDLGTSTERSLPNPGLIAFKEGLGCRTSGKRTYALDLA